MVIKELLTDMNQVYHRFCRFCVPLNRTVQHVGRFCIDIVSGMTSHEHLDRFCHFYTPFNRYNIGSAVFAHHSMGLYSMWLCTMVSNTVTLHDPNHDPNHDLNSVTLRDPATPRVWVMGQYWGGVSAAWGHPRRIYHYCRLSYLRSE